MQHCGTLFAESTIVKVSHGSLYSQLAALATGRLENHLHFHHDVGMIRGYFDWAATSPMSNEALQAYHDAAIEYIGNPSSVHPEGQRAAAFLRSCRRRVADVLGVGSETIVFTSGGTEADSIAILSQLWRKSPARIVFSAIEHDAVLQHKRIMEERGFDVCIAPAPSGYVDLDKLDRLLDVPVTLVCVMLANNVLGTVQDLKSIVALIREREQRQGRRIHIHCDAVQAIGKMKFDLTALGVDSAAFSAHKFQGPRGVGILYRRLGALESLSTGGGQEGGLRPGTESVAAIAALTVALEHAHGRLGESLAHMGMLRQLVERELCEEGAIVQLSPRHDSGCAMLPSVLNVSIPNLPSEVATRMLADQGWCVSSGSACSNNAKKKDNRLLTSMGYSPALANGSLRISFGPDCTVEACHALASALKTVAATARRT